MKRPIAWKTIDSTGLEAHRVSFDPIVGETLRSNASVKAPAIVIVRDATYIPGLNAGMFDANDIVSCTSGNWEDAVLVVWKEEPAFQIVDETESSSKGDADFLRRVERDAARLAILARQTLSAIRSAGVDGELYEVPGGRWVNRPLNTFTLKVQPRVGNLQFTIYGNPQSYDAEGFLLQDQNSYSRGWVRNIDDARKLAALAQLAHTRRNR